MGPLPCPTVRRPSHGPLRRRIENSRARGSSNPRRFAESLVTFADGAAHAASSSRHASRSVFRRFLFFFASPGAARSRSAATFFSVRGQSTRAIPEGLPRGTLSTFTASSFVSFLPETSPLEGSTGGRDKRSRIGPRNDVTSTFFPLWVISTTPSSTSSTATARVASISSRHRSEPRPHTNRGASLGHMDLSHPRARSTDKITSRRRCGRVGKGKDTTSVERREGCA